MGLQIKSRYEQLYCNLLWCFVAIFISGNVEGTCTPSDVTNDLQRCFRIQDIGWYYQFPIGHGSSFYKNLCANSTCMSYCLQEVASACVSYDFMTVLGNGSSLVAAYVGLCEQSQTDVQAFLDCGKDIGNQVALDSISDYQIKLESYFTNSNENATAICLDWNDMMVNLTALINGGCSDNTHWKTFLNTVSYFCDNTTTPQWYTNYSSYEVNICVSSSDMTSFPVMTLFLSMIFSLMSVLIVT